MEKAAAEMESFGFCFKTVQFTEADSFGVQFSKISVYAQHTEYSSLSEHSSDDEDIMDHHSNADMTITVDCWMSTFENIKVSINLQHLQLSLIASIQCTAGIAGHHLGKA